MDGHHLALPVEIETRPILLEREHERQTLEDWFASVAEGRNGRLGFVAGEAGVGKTALIEQFCLGRPHSVRILAGTCDPLFTPRPLGPLLDVSEVVGGELERVTTEGGKPYEVAAALIRELRTNGPTIFIVEDIHWADEATLDVLRIVGRRIESVPALLIASYRNDELDRAQPLRLFLGDLSAAGRLSLAALSPTAVAVLAELHEIDSEELFRVTAGNPFFVTEVLAAETLEIPETVRDAVLARATRLSDPARALLETVAVVPPQAEQWLLEALAGDNLAYLDECLASGMLGSERHAVAFRHELARLAVEESLPSGLRKGLHDRALAALEDPPDGAVDLARLAHHADAAGNAGAVLRYAPAAAERAASLGAHREAAAQYERALAFGDTLSLERQAELLERLSFECYLTDQSASAIDALERAHECYRQLGDIRREGAALCSLSRRVWCGGVTEEAERLAGESVVLLEQLPPGRELAMSYSTVASDFMNGEDAPATFDWSRRALELAEVVADAETRIHSLNNVGTMEALLGNVEGIQKLESSLRLAEEGRFEEHVGRAFIHIAWVAARTRRHDLLDRIDEGIEYCSEHGLDLWWLYLLAYRARIDVDRGRWTEAADAAAFVLGNMRSAALLKILASSVLGLVRARRGDSDYRRLLDEALELARSSGDLQHLAPIVCARAETAWLEGDRDTVERETASALELALRREASWVVGELAYWRQQAGIREPVAGVAAEPYRLQLSGDWRAARDRWLEIGCPYEAALAAADGDDGSARGALEDLQQMGARSAAGIVARRLRERGVRGLRRGPRSTTKESPSGLTAREVEVLALVADGLRNSDIAERLFLSEKTVGHHVSAILRKLDVGTRGQASAEAVRLGLLT
jgi:DNA-binding CsgD family transcriptional regulator/tetratricopeptide (TPR) repeat protein